jgi:hypothetical protein
MQGVTGKVPNCSPSPARMGRKSMSQISRASGTSTQSSVRCDKRAIIVQARAEFFYQLLGRLNCATVSSSECRRRQEMAPSTGQTKCLGGNGSTAQRLQSVPLARCARTIDSACASYWVGCLAGKMREAADPGPLGKFYDSRKRVLPFGDTGRHVRQNRCRPFSQLRPTSLHGDRRTSSAQSGRWLWLRG